MSCASCGSGSGSKPGGCQSNGGCSSGGCNRMNVFNWLSEIPLNELGKPFPIIEISFNQGSRKDYFRNSSNTIYEKGSMVAVEGIGGFDIGQVSLTGELVKLQMKKYGVKDTPELKKILRVATNSDLDAYYNAKSKEKDILIRGRAIAKTLNLEMKIAEAEFQADGKKVCFYYTADSRVDFRELIKVYNAEFKAKIEMRQIGSRQESSKVGGIGSCGRELCCSTWLSDFKTVNTTSARYQNLSINQSKLSGQCGRLKCCLNYELDTYMEALKEFPENAENLEVQNGKAFLVKKDIFRSLMWYGFAGSSRQYPLTIERVNEIIELNKAGKKPEELDYVELVKTTTTGKEKIIDAGFVNDVGQITLSNLTKNKKRKPQKKNQQKTQTTQNKPAHNKPAHPPKNKPQQQQQAKSENTNKINQQQNRQQNKPNQQQNKNRPKPINPPNENNGK